MGFNATQEKFVRISWPLFDLCRIRPTFRARLTGGTIAFDEDVLIGWEEVGGIEPVPFKILIPAGCFISSRGGVVVDDFLACSVRITAELARGPTDLTIREFEARAVDSAASNNILLRTARETE